MTLEAALLAARDWIAADIDEQTQRELQAHVDDPEQHALLLEEMSGALEFGTAGLRAIVGPGPMRMNRAVIRRTTAGVARYLKQRHGAGAGPVVVGADARLSSDAFRRETIGVLAAYGLTVRYFAAPVPTPLAAYAARRLQAPAAIVITASHNPAEYNGYKLYGADAVQIVPPVDEQVAAEIARSAPAREEPCLERAADGGVPGVEPIDPGLVEDYFRDVASLRPAEAPARDLCIAYTPLHGLGAAPVERVLSEAGFSNLHVLPAQREPDGRFPTVQFPNPEEAGALDRVTELGLAVHAELILANDPDVDRLAACIPDGAGGFQPLSGNQLGVLLADFCLERAPSTPRPLLVESIVSTPMLQALGAAHGAHVERTLTGFKWLCSAALELGARGDLRFVFGFEEALGYCAGPLVRDKDGISAALLLAELGALEKSRGGSLRERLARLYRQHGLWVSTQRGVTRQGLAGAAQIREAMDRLSSSPPERVGGATVNQVVDYRTGGSTRPRWLGETNLIELSLGRAGRVLVRPSGTEPKLKIYVDLSRPVGSAEVWATERALLGEARTLAAAMVTELGF